MVEEGLGIAAGVLTTLGTLPQIIKAIRTQSVGDVSVWTYVTLATGVFLWTAYGALQFDWPIIITNGISTILNLSMVYLCSKYRD
jgi:MtN3 and saliva related transmembrane protein